MCAFRQLVKHLRREFPEYHVSVRRCPHIRDMYGDCLKLDDGSYRIRVERKLPESAAIMVLVHEWSHVLCWDTDTHKSEHGPKFGLAYSRTWRSYLRWLDSGQ
jgi:hypothetical protein